MMNNFNGDIKRDLTNMVRFIIAAGMNHARYMGVLNRHDMVRRDLVRKWSGR